MTNAHTHARTIINGGHTLLSMCAGERLVTSVTRFRHTNPIERRLYAGDRSWSMLPTAGQDKSR